MATTSINCKQKGCKFIWGCVNPNTQAFEPIGLLNGATLNSSEDDSESSGQFGGTCSEDQDTPLQFTTNADGEEVLVDESRVEIDGTFYDVCGASNSGCTDELNLSGNMCLVRDCPVNGTDPAANQRKLGCGDSVHLRLVRVNPNGSLTPLYDGRDAKITSKNRTLQGGSGTDHTFDITATITDFTYGACFH